MIESYDRESWKEVMKKSYDKKAMIEKHEGYLIESHDRES